MTENTTITDQTVRAEIAEFVNRVLLHEAWEEDGEEVADWLLVRFDITRKA